MSGILDPGFDTLALHAGAVPDPATGARALPIHLSTSFVFDSSEHAASLFNLERAGHVYSRISNPTNAVLEERVAALEGGAGAIATASGQAELLLAIGTLAGAGSHIVASSALYGGSHNLLHYTLKRFGIATSFVKPGDLDAWRAAIRPNTKLLFGETLGNPGLDVLDIPNVAAIAHDAGLPLLVDSTFTTPWLMQPFAHGADLLFHSATKFLSGHGTVIGGVLVDSGRFDWDRAHAQHGRYPELCEPYDGFHGMVFTEESSTGAFLLRARREGLRDFGACLSPHSAWLILQGIETLPLRMARHVENTRKIVAFLAAHPQVARHQAAHPRHREATFPAVLKFLIQWRDLRIKQHGPRHRLRIGIARIRRQAENHHPQADPDLRRRKSGAVQRLHGVLHVGYQRLQFRCPEPFHRTRDLQQARITHPQHFLNCHGTLQPRPEGSPPASLPRRKPSGCLQARCPCGWRRCRPRH